MLSKLYRPKEFVWWQRHRQGKVVWNFSEYPLNQEILRSLAKGFFKMKILGLRCEAFSRHDINEFIFLNYYFIISNEKEIWKSLIWVRYNKLLIGGPNTVLCKINKPNFDSKKTQGKKHFFFLLIKKTLRKRIF